MFEKGEIIVAGEKYNLKFLYSGVRCEVIDPEQKKVKILEGPGKGRSVLADLSKFQKFDGVLEIEEENVPKFKIGARVTVLSKDQFEILTGKANYPNYTFYGDNTEELRGHKAVVIDNNVEFNNDLREFVVEIRMLTGDSEDCEFLLLESEFQEFYEKKKKFRLSFLDEEGTHHTKVIDAENLEEARKKAAPIRQEFYHMEL